MFDWIVKIILAILSFLGLYKPKQDPLVPKIPAQAPKKDIVEEQGPPDANYIAPVKFDANLVNEPKCQFANNCNPDVLYPINGLGPEYGGKEIPDDCPCLEFVQSP
jgi:hypothetical protein